MAMTDAQRREWITNHLDITHDKLTVDEARDWLRLLMKDKKSFLEHARYGFLNRRRKVRGDERIPRSEVEQFLMEFIIKIQLANHTYRYRISLPLFDIVGRKILMGFGLIPGGRFTRVGRPGQAKGQVLVLPNRGPAENQP